MANIPAFQSPRSDLTIRSVPPDKMEAIMNAVVDILGGRVEFSESAIYENVQEEPAKPDILHRKQCSRLTRHESHLWGMGLEVNECPGVSFERAGLG